MHEYSRHRILGNLANFVTRRPGVVLLLATLGAVLGIGVTIWKLEFQPNRNDLISRDLEWNQRFIDWSEQFPGSYDLIVVVDSLPPDREPAADRVQQAEQLVSALGRRLETSEHIDQVVWGFEQAQFSPKAARLLPLDAFARELEQLREARPLLESPTLEQLVGRIVSQMQAMANQANDTTTEQQAILALAGLEQVVAAVHDALAHPQQPVNLDVLGATEAMGQPISDTQFLTTDNGRLYFIRVTPRLEEGSLSPLAPAIQTLRQAIAELTPQFPGLEAGLTGIEVLEADETDAAMVDSTIASVVAFVLIAILLMLAFDSWRTPLLTMVALLFGIAWTFGFLTLTIGHLQVISVIFAVILLGLGVAFGIHIASTLEVVRHQFPAGVGGFAAAFRATLQRTGPGVVLGAITTAGAFATTTFTDFDGVAEMGQIASMGILLCLIAMFTVFPALMRLVKPQRAQISLLTQRRVHFFQEHWVMPFVRRPMVTLSITGVVTGLSIVAASQIQFDYDLMKLQPRGVDSVAWQQRISDQGDRSIWFAISVTDDLDQARARAEQFVDLPTVGGVGGIGLLFPPQEQAKLALLAPLREELSPLLEQVASPAAPKAAGEGQLLGQLELLGQMTRLVPADTPLAVQEALGSLRQRIEQTVAAGRSLDAAQRNDRLAQLQTAYAAFRQQAAGQMLAMLDPSPLTVEDLPAELLRSYRDPAGRFALEIYPQIPDDEASRASGPLHPDFLPRFIGDIESVDPHVTGVIVQIYKSGDLIKRAYQLAGLYALMVVFLLVWLDFRSVGDALLTLLPVSVGFALTFAIMWLLGMKINPANIMVLPLLFGIGVDDGVHMLHRYRLEPTRRPLGLVHGTGKGITITSLTAIIGFAAMMLARHRGIASLGFTLTLGLTLTTLACWTMMPACLELIERRRQKRLPPSENPQPAGPVSQETTQATVESA